MVQGNEIRLCHSWGVKCGQLHQGAQQLRASHGAIGSRRRRYSATGTVIKGVLIDGNEISYNNFAKFRPGNESGGAKFGVTDGLAARNNFVHHNDGPGLWLDANNIRAVLSTTRLKTIPPMAFVMRQVSRR